MKVLLYQFHVENCFSNEEHKYGKYWELSHKSCSKYAARHGFDYILDYYPNKESWNPLFSFMPEPGWEQFKAIQYLKDYDAVIFIDSDVLIKPNADNIVEEYKKENSNIVVNTRIGNKIFKMYESDTLQFNTGIIIWYNKTNRTNDFYNLKPKDYADNKGVFMQGDFIESRKDLRWWEKWDDFKSLIGKKKSGFYNDEKFLSLIVSIFDLTVSHLHHKYNYRFTNETEFNIISENVQFIHYVGHKKIHMQKHYNLIMEQ